MFAPKKILVPTDFSVYADNALKQAIDIAKSKQSQDIISFMSLMTGFNNVRSIIAWMKELCRKFIRTA